MAGGFMYDERGMRRSITSIRWTERFAKSELPIPRQRPLDSDSGVDIPGTGGTGGGGCCCDETHCLKVPGVTAPITPAFLEFRIPKNFRCGCDPDGSESGDILGSIRVYPTIDPLIWESIDDLMCLGTVETTIECTNTATWNWIVPGSVECTGTGCVWTYTDEHLPGGQWEAVGDCVNCNGCNNPEGGFPLFPTLGDTLAASCKDYDPPLDPLPPYWELDHVSDEDCDCTPVEPDFDGEEGVPATTECTGTKVIDATSTTVPTKWRLTIVPDLNYYGCDETTLQFIIGLDVVFEYRLSSPCGSRPFCLLCTNSFRIKTCGPTQCDFEPPSTICLTPKFNEGTQDETGCCTNLYWTVSVSGFVADADPVDGGECCTQLNGQTFLLSFTQPDDFGCWLVVIPYPKPFWGYLFQGPQCAGTDPFPTYPGVVRCGINNRALYAWTLECQGGGLMLRLWIVDYGSVFDNGIIRGPGPVAEWVTTGEYDCNDPDGVTLNCTAAGCSMIGSIITIKAVVP